MALITPPKEYTLAGLRAIKTAATVDGPLDPTQRAMLAAAQRYVLGTDHPIDALAPIEPGELARVVVEPALRRQLVQAMVMITLGGVAVSGRAVETIQSFARALEVSDATVDNVRRYVERKNLLLRFDYTRHSFIGDAMKKTVREAGVIDSLKMVSSLLGVSESPEIAARYHALEALPDGTLGKELYRFYRERGFAFPGEKGGAPEGVMSHDLSHVLSGYATDIEGEAHTLAFQAGYRRDNPMSFFFLIVAQIQAGVKLTYLADSSVGLLDKPGLVESLFRAYRRSAQMTVDLTDGWDFWPVVGVPVDELRRRYGVLPEA